MQGFLIAILDYGLFWNGAKTVANCLLFSGKKYNEEEEDEVAKTDWFI